MATTRNPLGFTLTELLVTIAIVGILAAIAYPSYLDQVRKSRRAEGKGLLLETAQALQKCRAIYGAYNKQDADGNHLCRMVDEITGGNSVDSTEGFYKVNAIAGPAAATFTLQAEPVKDDPACGRLTLDQAGARGVDGPGAVDECW